MRNRKEQQRLIKAKVSKEEKLYLYDYCGIKDPTPYEAVKNMIRRGESAARSATGAAVTAVTAVTVTKAATAAVS